MIHSLKGRLLQNVRTAVREIALEGQRVAAGPPARSIIEALRRAVAQPLPQFTSSSDQGRECRQQKVFGIYAIRSAIRGLLIGQMHLQAGRVLEREDFLAPAVAMYYTSTFHALVGVLALRGHVIVDTARGVANSELIVAKLTHHNTWAFEKRNKAHNVVWFALPEILAKPKSDLPAALVRRLEPDEGEDNTASRPAHTDAIKKRIRDIVGARHQALYLGYGFDDIAHDLVWNGDDGALHALGYRAMGFRELAADLLRSVFTDLEDLLVGAALPDEVLSVVLLGVHRPPFEMPDPSFLEALGEPLAQVTRLLSRLGVEAPA